MQRKIEDNGEKKSNHENGKKRKKAQNHQTQDQQQQNSQPDLDLLNRRKDKSEMTDVEGGTGSISDHYTLLQYCIVLFKVLFTGRFLRQLILRFQLLRIKRRRKSLINQSYKKIR